MEEIGGASERSVCDSHKLSYKSCLGGETDRDAAREEIKKRVWSAAGREHREAIEERSGTGGERTSGGEKETKYYDESPKRTM